MQFTKQDTLAVKGIAILMMLFHHLFLDASRYAGYTINFAPIGETKTVLIAQFCKICVAIFVFLSGYGITYSLNKINTDDNNACKKQVLKRYFSLMSGFWFVYIVCLAAVLIFDRSILSCYSANNYLNSVWFAIVDFMGLAELFGTPTMIGTWWYMSLAIIIVVAVPVLYRLYKKFGSIALLVTSMVICGIFSLTNYNMVRWIFTLSLGMICADKNLLARFKSAKIVKRNKYIDYIIKTIIYTTVLVLCVYLRTYADWTVSYLRDGIIPALVIIWCYTILFEIKFAFKILQFLGKYSMNIFLSHTLLRGYLLKDFVYSQKYSLLIFAVLLAISLAFAVVIDLLKMLTQYNKFTNYVTGKIMSKN